MGALLPFTGSLANGGFTLEHALIMAADAVNDAGGINGTPLLIISADTHSDSEHGLASAEKLLSTDHARVFVGPENTDAAVAVAPLVAAAHIVQILPGLMAPKLAEPGGGLAPLYFRLSAAPPLVACTLALKMSTDAKKQVAVLHAQDSYNQDMADGLAQHFSTGVVQLFPLDGTSFDQVALTDFAPDAIALFAFPVEAATVVQILASLNFGGRQLYLPPTLDDDGFLVNVLPDAVEGATGLSPYLPTYAEQPFAEAFAQRWMGEPPTGAAYFYYDAVALLALAMQEAITAGDSSFTSLGNDVVNISLSGGTSSTKGLSSCARARPSTTAAHRARSISPPTVIRPSSRCSAIGPSRGARSV